MIRLALVLTLIASPAFAQLLRGNPYGAGTQDNQRYMEQHGNDDYGYQSRQQSCTSTTYGNQTYTTCQ